MLPTYSLFFLYYLYTLLFALAGAASLADDDLSPASKGAQLNFAPRMSNHPVTPSSSSSSDAYLPPAPVVGEHTRRFLSEEGGLSDEEIDALVEAKCVGTVEGTQ